MAGTAGRPKAENPKNSLIKLRANTQEIQDLDYCCEKLSMSKSDVVRLGIQKVKAEAERIEAYGAQQED